MVAVPSGLILLNKKAGFTSFEALGEIKRALGTGKVGHTGTLDKFAQGLMLVMTGRALKLSPWFSHCDKQYIGKMRFGVETETLDPEGSPIAEAEIPSREKVEQALTQFTGNIMQTPPVYSAIHINGKRASALARSGETPQMKERLVTLYKLELRSWEPPFAEIFVHCSSGTYIRSLARDIALAADSRAHLCELTRTQVAGFKLGTGDRCSQSVRDNVPGRLQTITPIPDPRSPLPINKKVISALGLPWFEVEADAVQAIIHGKPLSPILDDRPLISQSKSSPTDFSAAVFSGEKLAAIVEKTGGKWKYGCVL